MNWDDVPLLLALMRAKNLHDAARQLSVDPSTISRRLTALERSVGARLFLRSREGIRPTASAERLRPIAEKMETDVATLEHVARAPDERARGLVRIAVTEGFSAMLVREGLLSLRTEYPDLSLELLAGNNAADLARGQADVAVRMTELKHASLRARCVARMGIGLFAAPAYVRTRGQIRSARELRGHDVVLASGELARLPESQWLARRPGLNVVFRSNSMPALVAAATAGHGVIALPIGWGDAEGRLERLLALDAVPARQVWVVTHESGGARAAVRIVADRIAAICTRVFGR